MEPAVKYDRPHTVSQHSSGGKERQIPEWETKLGKMIFYITCATAIWFFYWLNGIQCPC